MSENDPTPAETPKRKPRDPRDGESFNGPNVEFVLFEGPPDATSGPIPDYMLPYLNWWPRPEKPPQLKPPETPDAPA